MNNPFKKILINQEVPNTLKSKVLDDIGMIKLTYDIADFFLLKFPGTLSDFYIREELLNGKS
ncbi:hypothetical protein [Polaribacter aquimarinus]|uniref:Uncharacterized protein n=1 Tax=Polaribacter aquimarinus TaxID=2100726 RepID=A0A2U2J6V3_9FLAO|nr:hypothetical protein [Polaribacter aquimarinus]PWG04064.1 hypothetical protein DIS07_13925 [Polaribacter aquimarinus]